MGTFDALSIGDSFATPSRSLTGKDLSSLISIGGFTHPLFTDAAFAASSPFGRTPAPGQALLLLMGGLVEQSRRFDDTTIGLVGLDGVRFLKPAFAGDTLHVEVEITAKDARTSRDVLTMQWRCVNGTGDLIVETSATMLFRRDEP
jgi:acyl dehydratase